MFDNLDRQRDYHDDLAKAAGKPVPPPCSKTLHISLFFDGTGNNLNNDLYLSDTPHPTNIARLFRASIGAGYAGGTAHGASKAQGLTDAELAEYQRLKDMGRQCVKELFPAPPGRVNHQNEHDRGPVDERQNAQLVSGQVRALFDNQVHDSRAWFLHYALKGPARTMEQLLPRAHGVFRRGAE